MYKKFAEKMYLQKGVLKVLFRTNKFMHLFPVKQITEQRCVNLEAHIALMIMKNPLRGLCRSKL